MRLITWNVGGLVPKHPDQLHSLLQGLSEQKPEILVIGLQEIFEMKGKNLKQFMTSDENKGEIWREYLNSAVNEFGSF